MWVVRMLNSIFLSLRLVLSSFQLVFASFDRFEGVFGLVLVLLLLVILALQSLMSL